MNSNYFDKTLQDFLKKNPLIIHLNLKENLPKIIDLSGTKIIDLNIKTEENINFLPKLEKLEQFRIDFK